MPDSQVSLSCSEIQHNTDTVQLQHVKLSWLSGQRSNLSLIKYMVLLPLQLNLKCSYYYY